MPGQDVTVLIAGLVTCLIAVGVHAIVLRYRELEFGAYERIGRQHVAQRRRAWLGVARSGVPAGLLLRAEGMRGYVWAWITPRPPARGDHPMDCHEETLGWALTRAAARRQLDARREALSSARR